jgi:hypothetical protein
MARTGYPFDPGATPEYGAAMSDAPDRAVRLAVMRGFVDEGRPPSPDEIAGRLGVPQIEVEASLRRLADAHVLVLAPGTPYVWMANPFSAIPTPFRVEAGERRWWGNCIWDGLGILAAVGVDGRVSTACPDCGERLDVETSGAQARGEGVVHYSVPAAHWWDDIGST